MQELLIKGIMIIILIIGSFIIINKKDKYKLILSNLFWLFVPWMFCLLLYLCAGIQYTFELDVYSFAYIILILFSFAFGQCIIKNKKSEKNREYISQFSEKINMVPLFIISTISAILYIVYLTSTNNIQIGVTRNINTNSFSTLLLLISNASLVIWLYELMYSILNNKKITYYGVISGIVYNLPGIVISGRDALIIFLISTFIVFIYCGNYAKNDTKTKGRMYKKIKKYFFIALIVVILYLLLLSINRYGENEDSAINMFVWSAGCEFPEYLQYIYYNWGGVGKLIVNFIFYYTSQISKYSLIFNEYDGPYMFGLFQLHYISRIIPSSWNMSYSRVTQQIANITTNNAVPGMKVFWETAIGYSIYDFGKVGTCIISFFSGIFIKKIIIWCNDNSNILKILLQAFICVAMFLTIAISPLYDYFYIFPLFWLFLIILLRSKKTKYEKK